MHARTFTENDRQALAEHLLRMPLSDRRQRFFAFVSDSFIASVAARSDMRHMHGYFKDGRLVAAAHLAPEEAGTLEFSVSVDADFRGQGLAGKLLERSLAAAAAEDATSVVVRHESSNQAMRAVLLRLPPSALQPLQGEVGMRIDLPYLQAQRRTLQSREATATA